MKFGHGMNYYDLVEFHNVWLRMCISANEQRAMRDNYGFEGAF